MKKMLNQFKIQSSLLLLSCIFIFSACEQVTKSIERVPDAIGKVGEITVISDEDLWKSGMGDSMRFYYGGPYLILPQPEAIFELRHLEPTDFTGLHKILRNIVFLADLSDDNSVTTQLVKNAIGKENVLRAKEDESYTSAVVQDLNARGQAVIYLFANNKEKLTQALKDKAPAIHKMLNKKDQKRIVAKAYLSGKSSQRQQIIQDSLGFTIDVPKDFKIVHNENNLVWLRKETDKMTESILLHELPYKEKGQLTEEGLRALRDTLTHFISSNAAGSYMQTIDKPLPIFYNTTVTNNAYTLEARGLWDMKNDMLGGPYVSYLIYDENKKRLLFLDGFIFAPGEDKKVHMQKLEVILKSVKF